LSILSQLTIEDFPAASKETVLAPAKTESVVEMRGGGFGGGIT